jgi:hypothetical protein
MISAPQVRHFWVIGGSKRERGIFRKLNIEMIRSLFGGMPDGSASLSLISPNFANYLH